MNHGRELPLDRCPQCGIARPRLANHGVVSTKAHNGTNERLWAMYQCGSCGGMVMAVGTAGSGEITAIWPKPKTVATELPERARNFLKQALDSVNAPSGAIVLAASAVDAMLKDKGLRNGSLNARIDQAAASHLITAEMAAWAHEIRLDANDQRHADENAPMATQQDAERVIDFAGALGQFLYVLPDRVARGRKAPAP